MKRVYGSDNPMMVGFLRQVLMDNHIDCLVKNEYLMGGAGDLPVNECWPELWVMDDEFHERAKALVDAALKASSETVADWRCANCDEMIEGQFTQCWSCGLERPLVTEP